MKNRIISLFLIPLSLFLIPAALLADSAQDYRDMAQALYQKGLYAKAVEYFQQATQADPNDWQSFQAMGDAYMKMNDNVEALNAYQKSLQINPNNPTVQAQVNSLGGSTNGVAAAPPSNSSPGEFEESQPDNGNRTVVVEHRIPARRPRPQPVNYNDALAPMDHAKVWTSFELGYAYSQTGDLINGANAWASYINNPAYGLSGTALASNSGMDLAFELGFLINPNNGIALGIKYVSISDYTLNLNYNNAQTIAGTYYGSDYDHTTMSPYIIPITLDYYLFLPDSGGRFFLSAGVGYYFGAVHVERKYSAINQNYNSGTDPNWANEFDDFSGDLTSGTVGAQVGIGRDFAISRNMSISLFVRGRYAKLTNFQGNMTSNITGDYFNGGLAVWPDNTITIEDQANIGGIAGNKYATIDYTGFDAGLTLNFYSL